MHLLMMINICCGVCLQVGFKHSGFLRPGGNLVMKVYEVCVWLRVWLSDEHGP
jgi:hypothetical protein